MPPSEESNKIYNAFSSYVKDGGDEALIKDFSEDKLKLTLLQYYLDKGWPAYIAIEKRIEELKEDRISKRNSKEKWKDRLIGAGITIAVGLLISCLKIWLKL